MLLVVRLGTSPPGLQSGLNLQFPGKCLIARVSLGINVQISVIFAMVLVVCYVCQGLAPLGLQINPMWPFSGTSY